MMRLLVVGAAAMGAALLVRRESMPLADANQAALCGLIGANGTRRSLRSMLGSRVEEWRPGRRRGRPR